MDEKLLTEMERTLTGINSTNEGESWVSSGYLATKMFEWFPVLIAEVQRLREASEYALVEVDYVAKEWPRSRIHYKMTVVADKLRAALKME